MQHELGKVIGVGVHIIYMFVDQKNGIVLWRSTHLFKHLPNLWTSSRSSLGLSSLVSSWVETKCSASTFRNCGFHKTIGLLVCGKHPLLMFLTFCKFEQYVSACYSCANVETVMATSSIIVCSTTMFTRLPQPARLVSCCSY